MGKKILNIGAISGGCFLFAFPAQALTTYIGRAISFYSYTVAMVAAVIGLILVINIYYQRRKFFIHATPGSHFAISRGKLIAIIIIAFLVVIGVAVGLYVSSLPEPILD